MLIVIDAGNTNITTGVYDGEHLKAQWRVITDANMPEDKFNTLMSDLLITHNIIPDNINKAVISSVVPLIAANLIFFCRKTLGKTPQWVDAAFAAKFKMPIYYDNPAELGPDRIINAVAAYNKYKTSLIVADLGTATTIDAVSEKGEYLGGSISPGLIISANAMFKQSSMLPVIKLETPPEKVIAKNTVNSMLSGIIYGYAGLVDGIIKRMAIEMNSKPLIIATGGIANLIYNVSETIKFIEPDLTLEGLRLFGNLTK